MVSIERVNAVAATHGIDHVVELAIHLCIRHCCTGSGGRKDSWMTHAIALVDGRGRCHVALIELLEIGETELFAVGIVEQFRRVL